MSRPAESGWGRTGAWRREQPTPSELTCTRCTARSLYGYIGTDEDHVYTDLQRNLLTEALYALIYVSLADVFPAKPTYDVSKYPLIASEVPCCSRQRRRSRREVSSSRLPVHIPVYATL